ncbi:hypothetical protein [Maritalea porphyrae]|uniref:hypothetical protein n=1 Tax=Maritalea porphyrae TaxID=880732 RepID=UPI0022AFBFA1|nr:hypothetical protein [Maritalea porphyrae]MCZ4270896.1 hypothetical protein [Maritalea porphyrae]
MNLEDGTPNDSDYSSPDEEPTSEIVETDETTNESDVGEEVLEDGDDTDLETDGEEGDENVANEDEADPSEAEVEEYDIDGKKYKLPKEVIPHLMKDRDYTQKTQELAEHRKALAEYQSQKQAEIDQQVEAAQQFTQEYAQLHTIDGRLQEFNKLTPADWASWEQEDYMEAQQGFREYTVLKDQREKLFKSVEEKQKQVQHEKEQRSRVEQQAQEKQLAKLQEEAISEVKRVVPSWDKELAAKVSKFAIENGFSNEELRQASTDKRSMLMFHKAWRGHQLETEQKAAAQKAKAAITPQGQPLTQVAKGRTAPATTGLSDDLPMDEWQRRRNAQLRSRS